MSLKLYVLIRDDLSEAQQAVQAGHAVAQLVQELTKAKLAEWQEGGNTLVYLSVKSLPRWATILKDGGFIHCVFHDPDLWSWDGNYTSGGMDTAIAVAPNWTCQYLLFKDLPLAFQPNQPKSKKWWQR